MARRPLPDPIRAKCVIHNEEADCRWSFALERDKRGFWKSNPVCDDCRRSLIGDAKATGVWVQFYPLGRSNEVAQERNQKFQRNRKLLKKYSRPADERPRKAELPPDIKNVTLDAANEG
ncbi:hypothetical protein ACFLZ9_02140 [Patescibacteria group bacterium]